MHDLLVVPPDRLGGIRTKNDACLFQNQDGENTTKHYTCYAPTNDKDEGTKEDFYNKLQTVLDKMKEKDVTILNGRFQCKNRIKQQRI